MFSAGASALIASVVDTGHEGNSPPLCSNSDANPLSIRRPRHRFGLNDAPIDAGRIVALVPSTHHNRPPSDDRQEQPMLTAHDTRFEARGTSASRNDRKRQKDNKRH